MISIKATLSELDKWEALQAGTLAAYRSVLRALPQYAVDVEPKALEQHQGNLQAIA